MQIVHVDPGYGRLMELYSNTELEYVENSTYNPTSGVAFTCTSGSRSFFPNFDFTFEPSGQFYKKVWSMKFSFYADGGAFAVGFTHAVNAIGTSDAGLEFGSSQVRARRYVDGSVQEEIIADNSTGFHDVSITYAVTADGAGSYISASTITFDDKTDFQIYTSADVPFIPKYAGLSFSISGQNHVFISNVLLGQATYEGDGTGDIPSDDGIPASTPIYRLPTSATVTDFTAGDDGEYIGTANGQTLLQTVDASTLISIFGDKPVNHIVAYGAPGYRVGSAVTQATGISKSDDAITAHGSHALSFEKDMHVYDVWKIEDGSAFSNINGLQVGWRAGD